ncbi:MAG: hypothetical protein RIR48_1082 [Bacteroidota bacterium]|jgi:hypothetical protein
MNTNNLLQLINQKIYEHQIEIDGCSNELNKLKNQGILQSKLPDSKNLLILAGLKEKMIFHKCAQDVLTDLKKDIENAESN